MSDPLKTFRNMKSRCYNPKDVAYNSYGGKGITICEKWLRNPVSFATWAENHGFGPGKEIHRINNALSYSPNTCELLTREDHLKKHGCRKHEKSPKLPKEKRVIYHYGKAVIFRNIPESFKRSLKIMAAERGLKLQDVIVEALRRGFDAMKGEVGR